ncbi:MAG: class I tRNA ligase family protein, partial [Candidatus Sulcia muelleri]|nr:class I tRNA ligase family protein [Candidatus Karelsulcia muelleri]
IFDENICLKGRNLANKIWNAFILINTLKSVNFLKANIYAELAIKWFDNKINKFLSKIEFSIKKYRFSESFMMIYKLFFNDFCSLYLELIKSNSKILNKKIINKTIFFFKKIIKLFHPYMPFITEKIWQNFKSKKNENDLIITNFPKKYLFNNKLIKKFKKSITFISRIRNLRINNNISNNKKIKLLILSENKKKLFYSLILKLGNISSLHVFQKKPKKKYYSLIFETKEYFIPKLLNSNNLEQKIKKKIFIKKMFLKKIKNKINNKKFLEHASLDIVKKEKKKELDCIKNIFLLKKNINEF